MVDPKFRGNGPPTAPTVRPKAGHENDEISQEGEEEEEKQEARHGILLVNQIMMTVSVNIVDNLFTSLTLTGVPCGHCNNT